MSHEEIVHALKKFVASKSGISVENIELNTPLLEKRILKSIHVLDLMMLIENLSGKKISAKALKPGVFSSIDSICSHFFQGIYHEA